MRVFVWLVRAFLFFALFAFALNNRHTVVVQWFFGVDWRAPLVIVVLVAFASGCVVGILAMVPGRWRRWRKAPAPPDTAGRTGTVHAHGHAVRVRARAASAARRAVVTLDLQWLLIGLPLAFVLGWLASRLDLRQWRRDRRDAPRAYFEGLNLLLNEQQDKAIDVFIEAVQHDPDTTELHFALGNLFRRRGEFERAVRVHEHLLSRGDLKVADRERAQYALAQDFMKAGLLDRAEAAWLALQDTPYAAEAQLALLALHERSRDWVHAIDTASRLQAAGAGSFDVRIAHYHCEQALDADAAGDPQAADRALALALQAAANAPRAHLLRGERAARDGRPADALASWNELLVHSPGHFALVAEAYARVAHELGQSGAARAALEQAYKAEPRIELLQALRVLDDAPDDSRVIAHLERQPTLASAAAVLALPTSRWQPDTPARVLAAVQQAAKPLQRYRCAACGFEAHHYFWQCPGCQGWDTYPPKRLESQ